MKRNMVRIKPAILSLISLSIVLLFPFIANSQPNLQNLNPTFRQGSGVSEGGYPCLMDDETAFRKEALQSLRYAHQTSPDTGQVDYRDYDITIRLYPNRHYLEGDVQVIFRSKVAQLGRVDFQLYNDTLRIKSVTHRADTLSYTYVDSLEMLRVWLRDSLGVGQEDTLRIVYNGYITPELSRRMGYGCQLDSTMSYSLSPFVWYPCPYDLFNTYRTFDLGATGRVRMTVPRTWRAVSNGGLLDSTATDSTQTFTWGSANAISIFVFASGPFLMSIQPYSGILVRYYAFDTTDARSFLTYTTSVLNFYSRVFYPYSFEKLAFADLVGPISRYTIIFQSLSSNLRFWAMIHEVAHQWWPFLVKTRSLEEAWLYEGFATYSEVMFREDSLGMASRKGRLDTLALQYLDGVPPDSDRPIIPTPFNSMYGGNILYAKGGWVLHMLRGVVGDSTFFNVMKIGRAHV